MRARPIHHRAALLTIFAVVVALVVAALAYAAGISGTNETDGLLVLADNYPNPALDNATYGGVFHVGDIIHYHETATNVSGATATMDFLDFVYPDGSTLDLLSVPDCLNSGTGATFLANEERCWRAQGVPALNYTIKGTEAVVANGPAQYGGKYIRSRLFGTGTALNTPDPIDVSAYRSSLLLKPSILITKTVDFDGQPGFSHHEIGLQGCDATWKVEITNNGDTPLKITDLVDTISDPTSIIGKLPSGTSLAPGAKTEFTYVTKPTVDTTNVASVIATDVIGGPKGTVSKQDTASVEVLVPGVTVSKIVEFNPCDEDKLEGSKSETYLTGELATWKIKIENTGEVPFTSLSVEDEMVPAVGSPVNYDSVVQGQVDAAITALGGKFEPGDTIDVTIADNPTVDETNTVTVLGGVTPCQAVIELDQSSSAEVFVKTPKISVDKLVNFNPCDGPEGTDNGFTKSETYLKGESAEWKITIRNDGDVPFTAFSVTDICLVGGVPIDITGAVQPMIDSAIAGLGDKKLDSGESITVYLGALAEADETNTVTVDTGTTLCGKAWEFGQSSSAEFFVVEPKISVDKTVEFNPCDADELQGSKSETYLTGEPATWKIKITNDADVPLTAFDVSDTLDVGGAPTDLSAAIQAKVDAAMAALGDGKLDKNESISVEYVDNPTKDETNTVTVNSATTLCKKEWVFDQSSSAEVFVKEPKIQVDKTVNFNPCDGENGEDDGFTKSETYLSGEPAQWMITITNKGDVPFTAFNVTDELNQGGVSIDYSNLVQLAVNSQMAGLSDGKLDKDESISFKINEEPTTDETNTVTVVSGTTLCKKEWSFGQSSSAELFVKTPEISVDKTVEFNPCDEDKLEGSKSETYLTGEPATWHITISNDGSVPMTAFVVGDILQPKGQAPINLSSVLQTKVDAAMAALSDGQARRRREDHRRSHEQPDGRRDQHGHRRDGNDPVQEGLGLRPDRSSAEVFVKEPKISVDKVVNFNPCDGPEGTDNGFTKSETYLKGETATYRITIKNEGDVPFTAFEVTDKLVTGGAEADKSADVQALVDTEMAALSDGKLDKDETIVVEFESKPTEDETNTVTVVNGTTLCEKVWAFKSSTAEVFVKEPKISVDKTVEFNPCDQNELEGSKSETYLTGEQATWTITITNKGDVPFTAFDVTDKLVVGGADTDISAAVQAKVDAAMAALSDGKLDLNESIAVQYVDNPTKDETNTVTVATGTTLCKKVWAFDQSSSAEVFVKEPKISVDKVVNFNPCDGPEGTDNGFTKSETYLKGETATYRITIKNEGDVPFTAFEVTDKLVTGGAEADKSADVQALVDTEMAALSDGKLDKDETIVVEFESKPTEDETNTVTVVNGTTLCEKVWAFGKSSTAEVFVVEPDVSVDKTVEFCPDGKPSKAETYVAGQKATWYIKITNESVVPLTALVVTDTMTPGGTKDIQADVDAALAALSDSKLDKGESITISFETTVDEDTTNEVKVVSGTTLCDKDWLFGDTSSATAHVVHPKIEVKKTVEYDGNGTPSKSEEGTLGNTATWFIDITNSGDVGLEGLTLDDVLTPGGPVNLSAEVAAALPPSGILGAGQTITVKFTTTPSEDTTNNVTAEAHTPCAYKVSASDWAEVKVVKKCSPTRTVGFWQTHSAYVEHLFKNHSGGSSIDLGWNTADNTAEAEGFLWANRAYTDVYGSMKVALRRGPLSQAMIKVSRQLTAAIINTWLENPASTPLIGQAQDELKHAWTLYNQPNADKGEVKDCIATLDALNDGLTDFNQQGDYCELTDTHFPDGGRFWGPADPDAAKAIADYTKPNLLWKK